LYLFKKKEIINPNPWPGSSIMDCPDLPTRPLAKRLRAFFYFLLVGGGFQEKA
jgi:hypothetical protein